MNRTHRLHPLAGPRPPRVRDALARAAAVLALAAVTSCSGGGSSSGGGEKTGGAQVVVRTIPVSNLLSFEATLDEVRLFTASGDSSENLLAASTRMELQGLAEVGRWIAAGELPRETYTEVELVFDASTISARAEDGSSQNITSSSGMLRAAIEPPLVVDGASDETAYVTLDMIDSIDRSGGAGLEWAPRGDATPAVNALEVGVVYGTVERWNETAGAVTVQGFADADKLLAIGPIDLRVTDKTRTFDLTRVEIFDPADFFASLLEDQTVLRIAGAVQPYDALEGYKVDIIDQAGGTVQDVSLRGTVLGVDTGAQTFNLLIKEILAGSSLVDGVLAGLGSPSTIACSWDEDSQFYRKLNVDVLPDDLAIGQEVTALFRGFSAPPFLVDDVDISATETVFTGEVLTDSGTPLSVRISLSADDASVLAGLRNQGESLDFDLSGAQSNLIYTDAPPVANDALVNGQKLVVRADVIGTSFFAAGAAVHPGQLIDGIVSAIDRGNSSLTLSSSSIVQSFGNRIDEGPTEVSLSSSCSFKDGILDASGLFDLYEGLAPGETLSLRIKGVGQKTVGSLVAYEIRAEVLN